MTEHAFDCSATAIFGRLKERLEIQNDAELAVSLGCQRKNISKWRQRNSVPYAAVIRSCCRAGIDLDWILTGRFSAWTVGEVTS